VAWERHLSGSATPLWPLAIYGLAVLGLVAAILILSHLLGQRHSARSAGVPYESGIVSTGSPPLRIAAKFYLLALLFVVFDLEIAFLVVWAVAARELGWAAYAGIVVFVIVLAVALVYLWRLGALDWGTAARRDRADGGPAA
jgi:NADH-quinone oxidoreductase subunit A